MALCGGCGGGGRVLGGTGGSFLSPATTGSRRWKPDGAGGPERERGRAASGLERVRVSGVPLGLRDPTSSPCLFYFSFLFAQLTSFN